MQDQLKAKVDQMIADLDFNGAMTFAEQHTASRATLHKRLELEPQEEVLIVVTEVSGWPVTRHVDLYPRTLTRIEQSNNKLAHLCD